MRKIFSLTPRFMQKLNDCKLSLIPALAPPFVAIMAVVIIILLI
tara:strand:+ start:355 stop:486 length:132 start_codon:yes stop_codon:yes gene_type:complete